MKSMTDIWCATFVANSSQLFCSLGGFALTENSSQAATIRLNRRRTQRGKNGHSLGLTVALRPNIEARKKSIY
jgi:hypothetical protein